MAKNVTLDKVQMAAIVLWRYVLVKSQYRTVDTHLQRLSTKDLALHIRRQLRRRSRKVALFGEIIVEPDKAPPITGDATDDNFFVAIIREEGTIPDMDASTLAAIREFVLRGGDLPSRQPEPEEPSPGGPGVTVGSGKRGERL